MPKNSVEQSASKLHFNCEKCGKLFEVDRSTLKYKSVRHCSNECRWDVDLREYVEKWSEPIPIAGCWLWSGVLAENGYGRPLWKGKKYYAHRLSYSAFHGEIPKDGCVLHECDNRACVNPAHLWLGSQLQNIEDMKNKKRGWWQNGAR